MTFRASHLYGNRPDSVQGAFNADLPLTVVAHIISFLDDDVASLARLCRTSRVLWYMTLPHLWKNVTLKSYNMIRYKDDVPEGFGSASPFSMGLNALVTHVSNLVRSLNLEGEFGAADLQEHARAGRISESVMILNIAVRAVLDQATRLESFTWNLDVRIQPNVYAGLAKLSHLQSLWIRFPNTRSPQHAFEIPALPNLRSLTFTHYDPLCFPDDISTLLFHATKLQNLTMHYSPRMREQGETSVALTHFFRKNIAARRKIRLKSAGVYNLLGSADSIECLDALDIRGIEHVTSLNSFGLDEDAPLTESHATGVSTTHFIDRAWHMACKPEESAPLPKSVRMDQLHTRHAQDLGKFVGLERLYLVNARYKFTARTANGIRTNGNCDTSSESTAGVSADPSSSGRLTIEKPNSSRNTPVRTISTYSSVASLSLRDLYFDNIFTVCGPTLKHLILPARWPLPTSLTARLIRSCPNLTQLAAAIECLDHPQAEVLRLLVPFLSDLWAIRVLIPNGEDISCERPSNGKDSHTDFFTVPDRVHEEKMASSLAEPTGSLSNGTNGMDFSKLRYIGFGRRIWEIGSVVEEIVGKGIDGDKGDLNDGADGKATKQKVVFRRKVTRVEEKDVQHVEIWKMDSLEIV